MGYQRFISSSRCKNYPPAQYFPTVVRSGKSGACAFATKSSEFLMPNARSSVVEKVLLCHTEKGRVFGLRCRLKADAGRFDLVISVELCSFGTSRREETPDRTVIGWKFLLLPAIGSAIADVSTVFIGTHSLYPNRVVHSRAGNVLVSIMAKRRSILVFAAKHTKYPKRCSWTVSRNISSVFRRPFNRVPRSSLVVLQVH